MNSFLKYVAEDVFDKTNGKFQDTTIVFPNKRATLFFNQHLWQKSGGNAMWTPEYTTISELFTSLSPHNVADPVYLVCKLYETYLQHYPATDKSFDELYPLLEMMLADFEDIDNNLVPADKMFRNISELQDLTDYNYLEPEQVEAIRHFFNGLKWEDGTKEQKQFSTLWNKLLGIYDDFRTSLLNSSDAMLYEGMLKRLVIESYSTSKSSNDIVSAAEAEEELCCRLTSHTYVFVGFNVLNAVERKLFAFIKKHKDAYFYWDYDTSYCSGNPFSTEKHRHGFEAGMFIMENIREFGSALPCDHEAYHNMRKPKKINFIQSPTENAQARHINTWVTEEMKPSEKQNESAIVLCNENLLQAALHSIPPFLEDKNGNKNEEGKDKDNRLILNVTMGYPLSETPAFSLVQALLELQLRGFTKAGSWRYKQVAAVLKHPYVRRMTQGSANSTLLELTSKNIVFPKSTAFDDNAILSHIFTKRTGKDLTKYLAEVLNNAVAGLQSVCDVHNFDNQLYKESTFAAYTTINRFHNQQERLKDLDMLSDVTLSRLVMQTLQRTTIPFHGEPADGLQVMGFLETRNLDFRNVILLSAGEGQMPRANKRPSLIPYTLQVAFGMTTIDKEVSIYAYYFYRLLQRAESITVLWNSSTEDGHKGEMSRFLMQLMVENESIFGEGQEIGYSSFNTPSDPMGEPVISIEKTPEVIAKTLEKKQLSPSAILTYMKCPLQYFFQYVAKMRPDDEVSDDIDDAIFGDIFHYVMEQIYKPLRNRHITSSNISDIAKDTAYITRLIDKGFLIKLFKLTEEKSEERLTSQQISYSGAQLIKHHVLLTIIRMQLEADADTALQCEKTGGSLTILETEYKAYEDYDIAPEGIEPFTIKLGGIIDRIDQVDNGVSKTVRVVDYKTATNAQTASQVEDLFDSEKVGGNYHITQTMLYCDVLSKSGAFGTDTIPVVPAIMYYKNNKLKETAVVKLNYPGMQKEGNKKPAILDYKENCQADYLPLMFNVIEKIYSPSVPFTQCSDDHTCKYCDFKLICCRKPKGNY